MKKWIFGGIGAVVIIVVVLVVVGVSNLGPMIKKAVNTYGPKITKTEVSLADVGISIFSARAKLKGFYLGNPSGFKSPKAMSVKSVLVDVDEKSLTGDTIIIEKIEVIAPEITYEKKSGTDNFKTILNNVQKAVGADKAAPKKESSESGEGKKIIIKDFIVKDGKVNLAMSMLGGKGISAPLPDIHLKNIGEEKGGASPAETFKQVFAELYEKITGPAVTGILNEGLKSLGSGATAVTEGAKKQLETVGKGAKEGASAVTDKVKGLFGQ